MSDMLRDRCTTNTERRQVKLPVAVAAQFRARAASLGVPQSYLLHRWLTDAADQVKAGYGHLLPSGVRTRGDVGPTVQVRWTQGETEYREMCRLITSAGSGLTAVLRDAAAREAVAHPADVAPARPHRRSGADRCVPDPFPLFLAGRWSGAADDVADTCPRPGISVVYYFHHPDGTTGYIGSTQDMWKRPYAHRRDGMGWSTFTARECTDREAAYWLEASERLRHNLHRSGRDTVGGRITALLRDSASGSGQQLSLTA